MENLRISFIGGGNMASAIALGLSRTNAEAMDICISEPAREQRQRLASVLPDATIVNDNRAAVETADVVVLAVKPQVMRSVCRDLSDSKRHADCLFVSIAAGIRRADICAWLGGDAGVIRAMPNQPALIGRGMSAIAGALDASDRHRRQAELVLGSVGELLWIDDEGMMDEATAVSGSGPAYFYLLMEAMIDVAGEFGFSVADARRLVVSTAAGAAGIAAAEAGSIADLRKKVTSPGGTTEAAIQSMEAGGIRAIVRSALIAARERGRRLAENPD